MRGIHREQLTEHCEQIRFEPAIAMARPLRDQQGAHVAGFLAFVIAAEAQMPALEFEDARAQMVELPLIRGARLEVAAGSRCRRWSAPHFP